MKHRSPEPVIAQIKQEAPVNFGKPKLSLIYFTSDVTIDFQLVSKFQGEIELLDNGVSFLDGKGVKYFVPMSNIRSAIVK